MMPAYVSDTSVPIQRSGETLLASESVKVAVSAMTGRYQSVANCGTSESYSMTSTTEADMTSAAVITVSTLPARRPTQLALSSIPAAVIDRLATARTCGGLQKTASRPNVLCQTPSIGASSSVTAAPVNASVSGQWRTMSRQATWL